MEQQIQIKADDATLKGVYSNMALLSQNKEEFILDFLSNTPQAAILLQRIFMSPGHAKRLAQVLTDNVAMYEKNFGDISEAELPTQKIGFTANS